MFRMLRQINTSTTFDFFKSSHLLRLSTRLVACESPGRARQRRTSRQGCAFREPADPLSPASQAGSSAIVTALGSRLVACACRRMITCPISQGLCGPLAGRRFRQPASKPDRQAGRQADATAQGSRRVACKCPAAFQRYLNHRNLPMDSQAATFSRHGQTQTLPAVYHTNHLVSNTCLPSNRR